MHCELHQSAAIFNKCMLINFKIAYQNDLFKFDGTINMVVSTILYESESLVMLK